MVRLFKLHFLTYVARMSEVGWLGGSGSELAFPRLTNWGKLDLTLICARYIPTYFVPGGVFITPTGIMTSKLKKRIFLALDCSSVAKQLALVRKVACSNPIVTKA